MCTHSTDRICVEEALISIHLMSAFRLETYSSFVVTIWAAFSLLKEHSAAKFLQNLLDFKHGKLIFSNINMRSISKYEIIVFVNNNEWTQRICLKWIGVKWYKTQYTSIMAWKKGTKSYFTLETLRPSLRSWCNFYGLKIELTKKFKNANFPASIVNLIQWNKETSLLSTLDNLSIYLSKPSTLNLKN